MMNKQEKPGRLLLRVGEAADMLGVSRGRIYELIKSGTLPSVRIDGTMVRIPVDALNKWLKQQEMSK